MNDIKEHSNRVGFNPNAKPNRLYWVNILLLMVNVCLLVAFVWYLVASDTKMDPRMKSTSNEFLRSELNLSAKQLKELNELDRDNFNKTQVVLKLLCKQRNELLQEISKENPSKQKLREITDVTGHLYRGLNYQSVLHLLNIKSICNREQKQKLNNIFRELLGVDSQCKYCKEKCDKSKE